ncbi:MAG: HD domain-containing phosphohydrolase [Planctomycetota bacterium]
MSEPFDATNAPIILRWSPVHGVDSSSPCPPELAALFEQPEWREKLDALCRSTRIDHGARTIMPGVEVVGFSRGSDPTSRRDYELAVAFTEELLDHPELDAMASAAGTSAQGLRSAVRRVAVHTPGEIDRLAQYGDWALSREIELVSGRDDLVNTFSEQLSESYEHISLLLYVGRFMNHVADPHAVLQTVAQEVRRTMRYGWLALVVLEGRGAAVSISGTTAVMGSPPFSERALRTACEAYATSHPADAWTRVIDPGDEELGAIANGEILVEPITHEGRTVALIICGEKGGRRPVIDSVDIQILDAVADLMGVFHDNLRRYEQQVQMFMGVVGSLTAAIDAKDAYTKGHSERVAWGARELARALGHDEHTCERVHLAGLLHDIGKIGVPEAVLTKKGRLTEGEFDLIKKHPRIGYDILRGIPSLEDVLPGVLHHHEKWNGKGYPTGAAGEEISLFGRLLAVPDVFDALSSDRAYRKALPREEVIAEIQRCSGSHFDPRMARAFLDLDFTEFDELLRHSEETPGIAERKAA